MSFDVTGGPRRLSFTIRPNTAGSGWPDLEGHVEVPRVVAQVCASGRAKTATEVGAWIERMGWQPHEAPVFLVPLE